MKLLISGAILLCLTGTALTSAVLGIIIFSFLVIMSSPIWVPIATILLISMIGFLWVCGLGAALIFGLPWMYKYLRGTHPLGSGWVDGVRNQLMGTAGQIRDYARKYLRSKKSSLIIGNYAGIHHKIKPLRRAFHLWNNFSCQNFTTLLVHHNTDGNKVVDHLARRFILDLTSE
ncbi:hypothetical protein C5167_047223 [Papaver somniferum]|uniref:Oleosin n=1 Tax=Papaver somniferum TaxID=3469 RepID=A0A4Y7LHI1_PAPSO|nr:hypothetical protein C5167_047223 [Papaver somniferum]